MRPPMGAWMRGADLMVEDLLGLTLAIAIGFLLAVAFYESLATRDVLVGRGQRLARRLSDRWWVAGIAYLLTVAVGIPVLLVLWAAALETALFLVGSVELLDDLGLVAVAVVGAARILAYATEKIAHELAKAIPLALLFLILTGDNFDIDAKADALADRGPGEMTGEMLLFLIALELGMRLLTDGSHAALTAIRRRRGIESDLGVWRTLWAALRPSGPPGPPPSTTAPTNDEVAS